MMQVQKVSRSLCVALLVLAAGCGGRTPETGGTPGTTGTTGAVVKVTDVALGRAIGSDKAISDSTDNFRPTDTIYASVTTDGAAQSATLRARWTFEDGQTVDESSRTIAPANRERTEFHISKPNGWPAGKYKVEVFLNDQSAGTKNFEVQAR